MIHITFFVYYFSTVSVNDRCKLYCRVQNSSRYFLLKDKVVDGTRCSPDSFNKCVNGICKKAGCDNKLDSDMKLGNYITITVYVICSRKLFNVKVNFSSLTFSYYVCRIAWMYVLFYCSVLLISKHFRSKYYLS